MSILSSVRPPYRPRAVVAALEPHLLPDGSSGGYCFLMDLVRAVHFLRVEAVASDAPGSGASPSEPERTMGRDGVPFSLKLTRLRKGLRAWADEILDADEAKKRRLEEGKGGDTPFQQNHRQLTIDIAVDRILSPAGLGRSEWADLSLERLARMTFDDPPPPAELATRVSYVDYLIRRLRKRLQRRWQEIL